MTIKELEQILEVPRASGYPDSCRCLLGKYER